MRTNNTLNAQETRRVNSRTPFLRRAIPVTVASVFTAMLALGHQTGATAQDATPQDNRHARRCSNATLRGDYGILVSGIRGAGPGATEMFVGIALHTYDGDGSFTGINSSHGQLTGAVRDRPVTGTYEVNADCTGTATLFIPGVPFPIETTFVIVDNGKEVKEAVMSPQPNLVTAVQRRIR